MPQALLLYYLVPTKNACNCFLSTPHCGLWLRNVGQGTICMQVHLENEFCGCTNTWRDILLCSCNRQEHRDTTLTIVQSANVLVFGNTQEPQNCRTLAFPARIGCFSFFTIHSSANCVQISRIACAIRSKGMKFWKPTLVLPHLFIFPSLLPLPLHLRLALQPAFYNISAWRSLDGPNAADCTVTTSLLKSMLSSLVL